MQLYMQQKVFSFRDRFTIKEPDGRDRWFVEGELFTWGKVLHILDAGGRECAVLRQKVLSLMPRFFIEVGGMEVAQIVKEFTLFRPRFHVEGLPWVVEGNFWDHEYRMDAMGIPIMHVSKEWFTWGDSYRIDIDDETDELACLCVVLALDAAIEMSRSN